MTLELFAVWFVRLLGLYAGVGLFFALVFVTRGIERLDPAVVGATWGFRLIVLPATVALWPLLLRRWARGEPGPPVETNAHRRAALRGATRGTSRGTSRRPSDTRSRGEQA